MLQGRKFSGDAARTHAARVDILRQRGEGDARPQGQGRNVVLDKCSAHRASPRTASPSPRKIELDDKFEIWAPQMLRDVASKTSDHRRHGTTTATVLAQAIIRKAANRLPPA